VDAGTRVPILTPALTNRSDQTMVWLARAHVALAVKTMQRCGHLRKEAAKWAAKRHPGLKQLLITENDAVYRSRDLETAIISWCRDFSRCKVKNQIAARVYSKWLSSLKDCDTDQMEDEAVRHLAEAINLTTDSHVARCPAPGSY
jgi:hypothetical protein